MSLRTKDPDSVLDWKVDWAGYLQEGETITDSQWLVGPEEDGGISLGKKDHSETAAKAFLSGGIAGHVYRVTNRITTSFDRTDERSLMVRVVEL